MFGVSTFQFLPFALCPLSIHLHRNYIHYHADFLLGILRACDLNHTRARDMPAPVQQYPRRSADQSVKEPPAHKVALCAAPPSSPSSYVSRFTFHVSPVTRHPTPTLDTRHSTLSATLKIPSISKVFKAFQRKSFYPQTRRRARFSNLSTQLTHLTLTAVTNLTM